MDLKNKLYSMYKLKFPLLALLFIINSSIAFAAPVTYTALEQFVKQSNYQKAYLLALKLRLQSEGDPRFDYLYGLSALQTGHFNEAVFALDRVTVSSPRVIRPRLELARAYLKLNNKSAAIKEFNDVLSLSPPPIVRQKVNAYIVELKKENPQVQQSVIKKLASFSIGYDDNINFGTDNNEIDLPGFGQLKLNPSAIKQESGFAEAKLQMRYRKNISKKSNTFLIANLTQRQYFKDTDFDYTDLDLRTGITLNQDKNQYQFIARDRPILLDGKLHSNTIGLDAIIRRGLSAGKVVSGSLSLENYDSKKLPISDRKRVFLGAKLDQTMGEIQHQFNLYLGKEFPDKKAGKQFSRDVKGLGYKAAYDWNAKNKSFLNLDYRDYQHQAAYPVFPEKRNDKRTTLKLSHEWQINDKTAILFSARHINNKSNLELYDAKRNELKIGIRYEWD